jgi:hypothetical protein
MRSDQVDAQQRLLDMVLKKMHTNLMASKLKELGEEPAIHPDYAPAKMEDGQYLFFIKEVFLKDRELKNRTIDEIKSFCEEKKNIDGIFNIEQARTLKEIAPKIKHKDIKKFFENELTDQSVPDGEVRIRVDSLLSQEDLEQQRKVDALIKFHDSGREIPLTKERFSMLIKEYTSEVYILMKKNLSKKSVEEKRDRLDKIEGLIDKNKASLNYLRTQNIEDDKELIVDVTKFMHSTCYKGDLKSLNTLIENLGEGNLLAVFVLTPLQKESDKFDGLITLKGMESIIKKRVNFQNKDSAEWKKVLDLFGRKINESEEIKGLSDLSLEEINKRLSDLSLAGQDDGGPAARSTRVRGVGSAENVASGNREHGDGGPAKR